MATTDYDIGDQPTFQATFRNSTADLTNPTVVKFLLKDPNGGLTTLTFPTGITNPSVGVFEHNATKLTIAGRWTYRFNGEGTLITAGERVITVDASNFTTPLP